jgi:hypothetical protein
VQIILKRHSLSVLSLGVLLFLFARCAAPTAPAAKGSEAGPGGGIAIFPTEVLTPSSGSGATATPSSTPTPIPTATPTSLDTATSTPQPSPTRLSDTPSPTSTPVPPSATPTPPTDTPVAPTSTRPPPTNTPQPPPVVAATATPTTVPQGLNGNPWGYNFTCCTLITAPPSDFCSYFACIASFWNGRGHVEQCRDSMFKNRAASADRVRHTAATRGRCMPRSLIAC